MTEARRAKHREVAKEWQGIRTVSKSKHHLLAMHAIRRAMLLEVVRIKCYAITLKQETLDVARQRQSPHGSLLVLLQKFLCWRFRRRSSFDVEEIFELAQTRFARLILFCDFCSGQSHRRVL